MAADSLVAINISPIVFSLILAVLGYLWGSMLPAEWMARRRLGRSLHTLGENPGASASWRVMGAQAGLIVVLFDLLKGAVPYLVAQAFRLQGFWLVLPSIAPVIGHNWPAGRFDRGGHGLGAGGGVILSAGFPMMFYSALVGAIPAVLLFRSRWGVTIAAIAIPLGLWLMIRAGYPRDGIAVIISVAAILALRLLTAPSSRATE